MTLFNPGSLSPQQIITLAQSRLAAHRRALLDINELYGWLSSQADADLVTGIGFDVDALSAVRSALADAHAEYLLYSAGLPPGTYPQPASAYVYAASQIRVIGPQ